MAHALSEPLFHGTPALIQDGEALRTHPDDPADEAFVYATPDLEDAKRWGAAHLRAKPGGEVHVYEVELDQATLRRDERGGTSLSGRAVQAVSGRVVRHVLTLSWEEARPYLY